MSSGTAPALWPASPANSQPIAAHLLAAMQLAAFEPLRNGKFRLAATPPEWFRALEPERLNSPEIDLVEVFPAVESFLPEAQEVWNSTSTERACSDIWAETRPGGGEVFLQAWALKIAVFPFLVIEAADALHRQRQLVLQYAHETALQNDTIARLVREVERATQAKSDFLATISHEIRTPINAILGMADVLAETPLTSEQRRYVDIFQRSASSLLDLLNDVLDMSKIEAGHLALEATPFDLREVVSRAVELVAIRAGEKGLRVQQEIKLDVPAWVTGDPVRLRQILINLLGNATKFTESGGIGVRISRDTNAASGTSLLFAVSDSGIGIPEDKRATIFDSFAQADLSTTRKYGGTGLGLSICKKLVEAMGGRVWVESTVGIGSTFFFTVQFAEAIAPAERDASATRSSPTSGALRILIADDSWENQAVIRAYLQATHWTLKFVDDGAEALDELKSGNYDVALLDLHMPTISGDEVMRAFREYERAQNLPPLPVLALTADAFQESVEQSLACGFTMHLAKPIRKATLLEAIGRHTQARSADETGARKIELFVDRELAAIVPKYLDNLRRQVSLMTASLAAQDFHAIFLLGHNMKGTGSMVGIPRISKIGEQLEAAARAQDTGAIKRLTDELVLLLESMNIQYK